MSWLDIVKGIVGVGETVVPIFIHNPKSQQVEAVVVTTLDHVLENTTPAPPANAK